VTHRKNEFDGLKTVKFFDFKHYLSVIVAKQS